MQSPGAAACLAHVRSAGWKGLSQGRRGGRDEAPRGGGPEGPWRPLCGASAFSSLGDGASREVQGMIRSDLFLNRIPCGCARKRPKGMKNGGGGGWSFIRGWQWLN